MEGLIVELWVDDHQEYEPGVVHAHLRHARVPLDPRPGDYVVVGDDEIEPALAEVLSRSDVGNLRLRMLPGPAKNRPELQNRRQPAAT
ncbi:MAG TPA: hypothetical protein VNA57_07380 [Acidimicrobiales bacterium]|nr:hypothetical protein [Acidimicrobiales bacterium]